MHVETKSASTRGPLPSKKLTAGEQLSDGSLIELVRTADASGLQLLIWNGQDARFAPSFVSGDFEYVAIERPTSLLAGVNFPKSTVDYGSTRELFDEVSLLMERFA